MDVSAVLFAFALISGVVCLFFCVSIAKKKGRDPANWAILGLFFGVIALIVLLLLPEEVPVPAGLRQVTCPRCNAKQNVPTAPSYECWQCKLVTPLAP